MKKILLVLGILTLVLVAGSAAQAADSSPPVENASQGISNPKADQPIIIDHNTVDISAVPQTWIETAKQDLHIGYGHTSHGWQVTYGMTDLVAFANNGGLGLSLPESIFQLSSTSNEGGTHLHLFNGDGYGTGDLDHDAGYYPDWVNETREYLGTPDPVTGRGSLHSEMNVIMWSWCGQVSGYSEQNMIDRYLTPMTQLELDYPGITFVYMTGHADGFGESGNLHIRNQQIRQYAIDNNKVLYDFYDIELYDPDGNYYGDKAVNDNCDYDTDGNGSRDANWCLDWQNSHTQGVDWFNVTNCFHSKSINCNQKAYAAWWLWASLAGWDGQPVNRASVSSGVWSTPVIWEQETVPEISDAIKIATGTRVILDADTHCRSIFVEPGGTLIIPEEYQLTVSEQVDNQGTIQLNRIVNAGTEVSFEITNYTKSTRYPLVDILGYDNLGAVAVKMRELADGEYCTSDEFSDPYIPRCFEIEIGVSEPENKSAKVRLWALTEEMDRIVGTPRIFRYVGSVWTELTEQSLTGEQGGYTFVEADTPGFSHFLIGGSSDGPDAIELVEFDARGIQPSLVIILILASSLVLLTCIALAFRRLER